MKSSSLFCSKQYVPGLLRWKGVLSERQVKEVLDVSRELGLYPSPTRVNLYPLKGLFLLHIACILYSHMKTNKTVFNNGNCRSTVVVSCF